MTALNTNSYTKQKSPNWAKNETAENQHIWFKLLWPPVWYDELNHGKKKSHYGNTYLMRVKLAGQPAYGSDLAADKSSYIGSWF